MSIASEISRLMTAKANLKTAIEGKGVTVPASDTLDDYAALVSSISQGGGSPNLQNKSKSYTPSETAQSENVSADTGYDGLGTVAVSVGAVSSTYVGSGIARKNSSDLSANNLTVTAPAGYYASNATKTLTDSNLVAGNIKNGVTIFGTTGTYTGSSATVKSTTATLYTAGNSISFTNLSGTPIAWFARCTTQLASSGSTTYYYVADVRYNGTNTQGTLFRIGSTRRIQNQTTGISYTYSSNTLTITTTATAAGATPGFFYNGTYELTYVY